jgi:hypothetical protein
VGCGVWGENQGIRESGSQVWGGFGTVRLCDFETMGDWVIERFGEMNDYYLMISN